MQVGFDAAVAGGGVVRLSGGDGGVGLGGRVSLRESQVGGHGVAVEGGFFDSGCPVGFVHFQACRGFTVESHQIELFVVDGGVVLVNSLSESLRIEV